MARLKALLCSTGLLISLGSGLAVAGPCTGQIADLEKLAASSGTATTAAPVTTGSTQAPTGGSTAGAGTPPGISAAKGMVPAQQAGAAQQAAPSPSASSSGPSDAKPGGTGEQAGMAPGVSAAKGMTNSTGTASGATAQAPSPAPQNLAASAQDTRAQQQGLPTAAQTAQQQTHSGGGAASSNPQFAAALNRARQADLQGNQADCTSALNEAKGLIGSH